MGADRGARKVTLSNLDQAAGELLNEGGDRRIWLVSGEMGSGKTTLIKALCRRLHVDGSLASPSFALIHEYRNPSGEAVYHFDLYRLKNQQEVMDVGIEEYLESGRYCFIEWPERAPGLSKIPHASVHLAHVNESTRLLSLTLHD